MTLALCVKQNYITWRTRESQNIYTNIKQTRKTSALPRSCFEKICSPPFCYSICLLLLIYNRFKSEEVDN